MTPQGAPCPFTRFAGPILPTPTTERSRSSQLPRGSRSSNGLTPEHAALVAETFVQGGKKTETVCEALGSVRGVAQMGVWSHSKR